MEHRGAILAHFHSSHRIPKGLEKAIVHQNGEHIEHLARNRLPRPSIAFLRNEQPSERMQLIAHVQRRIEVAEFLMQEAHDAVVFRSVTALVAHRTPAIAEHEADQQSVLDGRDVPFIMS